MSKDNIYPELSDQIVERWRKVTTHAIAGTRLDPYVTGKRITFLLESSEKNFNIETKQLTFDYQTDVIELYSDAEKRMFQALNRPLFAQGFIAPYTEQEKPTDLSSVYTDAELLAMLSLRKAELETTLHTITSWATVGRLIALLRPSDPQWKRTLLENKQQALIGQN